MLARLAEMNLRILAFTLDNGFISDEAKANIRRVVNVLGIDHEFGSTSAMNEIFVDSLKRFSNVCQGCFKTIYTLSMNIALEKNIPFIVTGLSRGQFFETRLTADLFQDPCANLVQIDQTVLDARKAYHRVDDAVSQLLDVSSVQDASTFERVQYVDFYRYCDVDLDEMLAYLKQRLPWIRPGDTGRSTNCLINDVGIYVHNRNEGYHNYALPYAWDVRMGHKNRDAALDELNDDIDVENVHRILNEIGYDGELANTDEGDRLVAYYTGSKEIPADRLKQHLQQRLPAYMIPGRFVHLPSIPMSRNGKIDLSALPDPTESKVKTTVDYVAASDEIEARLATIWREVLRVPKVGVRDNFFDLGGDSILAIQIVARANRAGIRITPSHLFDTLTIQKLAQAWRDCDDQGSFGEEDDPVLTPIQLWALECQPESGDFWNQSIEIRLPNEPGGLAVDVVRQSLAFLSNFHGVLRTKILPNGNVVSLPPISVHQFPLQSADLREADDEEIARVYSRIQENLNQQINFGSDVVLGGAIVSRSVDDYRLLMIANHMAVDSVSWHQLIDDFNVCYQAFARGAVPELHPVPTFAQWSNTIENSFDGRAIRFAARLLEFGFAGPSSLSQANIGFYSGIVRRACVVFGPRSITAAGHGLASGTREYSTNYCSPHSQDH